jgi:hypothetical protein
VVEIGDMSASFTMLKAWEKQPDLPLIGRSIVDER